MRVALLITVGAAVVQAGGGCAPSGLYMICARGSGEPANYTDPSRYTINTGAAGYLAAQIALHVPESIIEGVDYPATSPTSETNLTSYYASENAGAKAIVDLIIEYNSTCPGGKIALIGYSQGAQLVQDALCGGTGGHFNSNPPLPSDLVKNNIIAIALIADPTHIANTTYDRGTSTHNGVFPRTNTTSCHQYSDLMSSWCEENDRYCDSGNSTTIHNEELVIYGYDVIQFVVGKWNASAAHDKPNAASSLALSQSLLAGVSMMLVLWLL
ncbi:cutinase domain-containing protein [Trichoderma evansii]